MNLTPNTRRRLYEVAIAASAIAVGYGLLTSEQALLWVGLAAPVIGVARANVSSGPKDERGAIDVGTAVVCVLLGLILLAALGYLHR